MSAEADEGPDEAKGRGSADAGADDGGGEARDRPAQSAETPRDLPRAPAGPIGRTRIGFRDHLVGLLLAVSYVGLLLSTSSGLAMSRDESFYVTAADSYAGWYRLLFDDSHAALQQQNIDRLWSYNHEHPAAMKTLFAWSSVAQAKWHLFSHDSSGYRFPGMLAAGLLLWLIYIFGARVWDRQVGAFAAVAFALMPRVFYHAHLDCFDVPIAAAILLVTYCYWRSLERPRWALATGLAFGLALAIKHNAWMVPGIFLVHYGWTVAGEVRARRRGEGRFVSLVPWWLVCMLLMGPLIFVGSWPWLWHDTLARMGAYARFHLHHAYYNMEYFGRNYFWPPFPVFFPVVMTAYTVPLTTLVLAAVGLGMRGRAILPGPLVARLWPRPRPARPAPAEVVAPDRRYTDVLFVGSILAPMLAIALPSEPIFGGTKHWFPAYPFLAIYAGLAFAWAARVLRRVVADCLPAVSTWTPVAAALVLLAPAAVQTVHSHPFGLSDYGFLAGGTPGAADDGMNRQFWGFTTGSLASWFRSHMPNGGTVWICDTTWGAWQMMQRDGMIPDNIRATGDMASADYAIVHHEVHFNEVDYQAWVAWGSVKPAYVLTQDGVPIITVYENPRHRRR